MKEALDKDFFVHLVIFVFIIAGSLGVFAYVSEVGPKVETAAHMNSAAAAGSCILTEDNHIAC